MWAERCARSQRVYLTDYRLAPSARAGGGRGGSAARRPVIVLAECTRRTFPATPTGPPRHRHFLVRQGEKGVNPCGDIGDRQACPRKGGWPVGPPGPGGPGHARVVSSCPARRPSDGRGGGRTGRTYWVASPPAAVAPREGPDVQADT